MTTWLPSGKLGDGTLLFGPLREKPKDTDPVLEVKIGDKTWWVKYCCQELTPSQKDEVRTWVKKQIGKAV